MYEERELTVEQIGAVLAVSRTSIYRALGRTAAPAHSAAAAPAPAHMAEPVAATTEEAEEAPAASATRAPARVRVAVVSGHTSQTAARTALGRARSRARSGVGEGALLQVRAAEQLSSRLVWDHQAGRGVVQPGPPP